MNRFTRLTQKILPLETREEVKTKEDTEQNMKSNPHEVVFSMEAASGLGFDEGELPFHVNGLDLFIEGRSCK